MASTPLVKITILTKNMTTLVVKSRECLVKDITCLEFKLSSLQLRFDVIVSWIRSEYPDLNGLPDHVSIAIAGIATLDETKDEVEQIEHVKVECNDFDDPFEDSFYLNDTDDTAVDSQRQNLPATVDKDILKSIESSPVSRLGRQRPQSHSAGRNILQNNKYQRTTIRDELSALSLLSEVDVKLKLENDLLADDDSMDRNETEEISGNNIKQTLRDYDTPLSDLKRKNVKKGTKYLEDNRKKGLILDAAEYKKRTELLQEDRLACIVCSKKFPTYKQVRRHEFEVHLTKEEVYKLRQSSSSAYVQARLTNADPTMCDICNQSFVNIEAHKMNHLPPEVITTVEGSCRPQYRCLKCNSLFPIKKHYLDHVKRDCKAEEMLNNSNYAEHVQKLRTEKNFLCNQCGQAFNRKYTLQIHIKSVHAKRKDFKCQYCDKAFTVENVKNYHEKKHLGTASVTCDLCGFVFTCRRGLQKHIAGVHKNLRPHECRLCGKRFKTSTACKYHINTHGNPNGRKRGLNRDVDPMHAAAKRRNCINLQKNSVRIVMEDSVTKDSAKSSENSVDLSTKSDK